MPALARTTIPTPTIPVPFLIVDAISSAIGNAIVASGNLTLLSSATGLLQVCTRLPDGTIRQSTLAAYLAEIGLKLKDVVPHMVRAGFVEIVDSGPKTAFALPGTIVVTDAPSVDECDTTSMRAEICDRAAQLAPLRLSAIGLDECINALMAQLKEQDPSAKLKDVLTTDQQRRFNIDGILGLTTVLLAATLVSQDAPVPPTSVSAVSQDKTTPSPLKAVLDTLNIGPKGVLASTVGKMEEVKLLAIGTSLKRLVVCESEYTIRIAVPGSPGTATIFKVVSAA